MKLTSDSQYEYISAFYFKRSFVKILGETGYSQYSFRISTPPSGGKCMSRPLTGYAINTKFLISCLGWTGGSNTLGYSVSLVTRVAQKGGLTDDSESSIISYGHVPRVNITLPEGKKERDYMQLLVIRIIDSFDLSTAVNLTVKVISLQ